MFLFIYLLLVVLYLLLLVRKSYIQYYESDALNVGAELDAIFSLLLQFLRTIDDAHGVYLS